MSAHTCHAIGCSVHVPPRMLFCRPHWFKVPAADRDLVWAHYRPGQEVKKSPSREYMDATSRIISELAAREGVTPASRRSAKGRV